MSETSAATPKVRPSRAPSLIWIVPVIVALVGGWLIFKTLSEKGPVVTVAFRTADGIEVGKTKIRYKNIEIGVVESVRFSDDLSYVLLSAQMAKDATTGSNWQQPTGQIMQAVGTMTSNICQAAGASDPTAPVVPPVVPPTPPTASSQWIDGIDNEMILVGGLVAVVGGIILLRK